MATPGEVADFHQLSDLDARENAQHHTLGTGAFQAAPGGKTHRRLTTLESGFQVLSDHFTATSITDANAATEPGWYLLSATGASNSPDNTLSWWLYNIKADSGAIKQIAYATSGNSVAEYRRSYLSSGSWSVWTVANKPRASYTPTITGFTVGNGSAGAAYSVSGGRVFVELSITLGSTSAFTGDLAITNPINGTGITTVRGDGRIVRGSTYVDLLVIGSTTGANVRYRVAQSGQTYLNQGTFASGSPWAWASGDQVTAAWSYQLP